MFKLLALRVLDGCASHIKKCLKENVYYYFCTDYRFDIPGKIYKGNKYTHPLPDDFFSLPAQDSFMDTEASPTININAIVGKNGDGKSSIVEIMMRLINNYIAFYSKDNNSIGNQRLLPIKDVRAELYFLKDNYIYILCESNISQPSVRKIANLNFFQKQPDAQYIDAENNMIDDQHEIFNSIYTLISNYSHYAYNIFDFKNEWTFQSHNMSEYEKNDACWLFHIFHKNDGYLTPFTLHPYRMSGNFDINRENLLSQQRLLLLYINAKNTDNTFRDAFDKKAIAIKFIDPQESKLQKITLAEYLNNTWMEDPSLNWAISDIESLQKNIINKNNYEDVLNQLNARTLKPAQDALDTLIGISHQTEDNYSLFISKMNEYIRTYIPECLPGKKHGKFKAQDPNIAKYIHAVRHLQIQLGKMGIVYNMTEPILKCQENSNKYKGYAGFNTIQLARVRLIYQVATMFKINPFVIFTNYKDLSEHQKCEHYIIYKIISIFHTYPEYSNIINRKRSNNETLFEATDSDLQMLYTLLDRDIKQESHNTRKLRQALTYIKNKEINLYRDKMPHLDINTDSHEHSFCIAIKDIKGKNEYLDINNLPPAIYEYDIIFEKNGSYIGMHTLSSGEKQQLNSIGAILYHLYNINSKHRYDSVNLVLEEIELYFHPEFQRQFILRLIQQIHSADLTYIKNINITFVTHSPFVLSDIPKSNVLFLKDGQPDYSMQENTFGANIHSLLKNGFFLPNLPMGEFAYQKINDLFRILNEHQYEDNNEEHIKRLKQKITLIGEPYLREQAYKLLLHQ